MTLVRLRTLRKVSIVFIFIFASVFELYSQTLTQDKTKPQIALLGTFHFAGSSDLLSVEIDDLNTEKRQREMQELIDKLKEYNPTKVVLEYPYGKTKLDSIYQRYREGNHQLSINERQQIGFRLANQLGHEHIYVADHPANLPFSELMQFIEAEGKMGEFNQLIADIKQNKMVPQKLYYDSHTLTDYFVMMNSKQNDLDNRASYLQYLLKYGTKENSVGVQLAEKWWARNFHIMFNIDQLTEQGDRLFVLFGQGHTALLKQFYLDRTDVEYVEIKDYLQ
ncbi:MAG: DUF5694 domain-containing protein [Fulvivirga sp.]|uniref:DUF5694 domain-containing protein n=1 Tax=Fulvivirga sp. TaxID=1931237 RepID=UPI0032EC4D84